MSKNTFIKIGIVIMGYIFALAGAFLAVYIHDLATEGTDAQASAGMYAFGDAILFLVVLGMLALIPTALMFYFLRPIEKFWNGFAVLCLVFAITRPAVAFANTLIRVTGGYSLNNLSSNPWADLFSLAGVLGIFAAPVFMVGFLMLTIIAPSRRSRILMLIAAGCEGLAGFYMLVNFLFFQRFF